MPEAAVAGVEDTLAVVPLLSRLGRRQLERLAGLAVTRSYREDATIVREGDTSMSLYVVLSGRVRVEREGGTVRVAELGPGGCFGEMGLLEDRPRSATVVALDRTECALLAKWDFQNELRDDPDIAIALLPVLTERIRNLDVRLAAAEARAPAAATGK